MDSKLANYDGTPYLEFLLHWKGYGIVDRTWETATQFKQTDPLVKKFYATNPFKPHWKSAEAKSNKRRSSGRETIKKEVTQKKVVPKTEKVVDLDVVDDDQDEDEQNDEQEDEPEDEEDEEETQPRKKRQAVLTRKTSVKLREDLIKVSKKRKREDSEDDDYVDEPTAISDAEADEEGDGASSDDGFEILSDEEESDGELLNVSAC